MLLNFQDRFAALVESGEKHQTIRAPRKDGRAPKVGERAYLWTGVRTKASRKLGEGEIEVVTRILIEDDSIGWWDASGGWWCPHLPFDEHQIAQADGFEDVPALAEWFRETHGLPFEGHLIRWRMMPREEWRKL